MTTVVEITKEQVIKALKTEPLKAGNWITLGRSGPDGEWIEYDDSSCPVCAVGAVLRNTLDEKKYRITDAAWYIFDGGQGGDPTLRVHSDNESDLLASLNGPHIVRLSQYFEGLWSLARKRGRNWDLSRHQIYRIRKKMIAFVESTFPKSFKLDINGYKPKEGIKSWQK